jgi:hypothetical protein
MAVDGRSFADRLDQAKGGLQEILAARSISRIVCVDDQYGKDTRESRELIRRVGVARRAGIELPKSISELFEIADGDDELINERQIDAHWSEVPGPDRERALADISEVTKDAKEAASLTSLEVLERMVVGFDFVPLAEEGWRERREELTQPDVVGKTLFLFDRSFGGPSESEKGLELVNELAASHPEALCGLLTATVGPNEELELWESLTYKDRMVVISKGRLGDDPANVVPAVRRTLLNPWRTVLLDALEKMLEEANHETLKLLRNLDIHSLEHLVFTTSANEGIWEPDTLLRLYALRWRRFARKKARDDPKIIEAVKAIRALAIKPEIYHGSEEQSARDVMHEEWYEESEHINSLHLPLDLGDIFQVEREGAEPRTFILMSQACDLMIRVSGDRPNDVMEVDALKVELGQSGAHRSDWLDLDYWADASAGQDWHARMRPILRFSLDVLDLCTFDARGRAVYGEQRQIDKDRLAVSGLARLDRLDKLFEKALESFRLVTANAAKAEGDDQGKLRAIAEAQLPVLCSNYTKLSRAAVDGNSVTYKLTRIGRLSLPRAADLLAQFSAYNARGAFDHDLARFPSDS